MKKLEELKKKVISWSGFELEGETKQEMKNSLSDIKYKLECEISDYERKLSKLVDELDIDDGS